MCRRRNSFFRHLPLEIIAKFPLLISQGVRHVPRKF